MLSAFGTVRGGLGVGAEGDERKTGYDVCHSLFLRRTHSAFHLLGPPSRFSPLRSSLEQVQAAHIPLERGGATVLHPRF